MDMTWYLQRIKKMRIEEVIHKTWGRLVSPIRVRTIRNIRIPLMRNSGVEPCACGPNHLSMESLLFAERTLAGERYLLGLGWVPKDGWDWHLDVLSGMRWPATSSVSLDYRTPGKEIRMCWELNRFHDVLELARAFWATKDDKYKAGLQEVLQDWHAHNPVGVGPNWVSSMEAAIRIVNLTAAARLVASSHIRAAHPEPSDGRDHNHDTASESNSNAALIQFIGVLVHQHLLFVKQGLSVGTSANNHLLVELTGIVYAEAFWTDNLVSLTSAVNRYVDALESQLYPSGLHKEMSSHYHLFVAESAVHVWSAALARGLPLERLEHCILRMRTVIEALTVEDGICRLGDDDEGAIMRFYEKEYAWDQVLSGRTANPWVTMPNFRVLGASALVQHFDGLHVIRGQSYRAVIDTGPHGLSPLYAHAHADDMSIYVAIQGHWVLTDPGTFCYYFNPVLREHFCSAAVHNGPMVEGMEASSRMTGPFMWNHAPEHSYVASHSVTQADGFTARFTLVKGTRRTPFVTRKVTCTSNTIEIRDAAPSNFLRSVITIAPDLQVTHEDQDAIRLNRKGFPPIDLTVHGTASLQAMSYSCKFGYLGSTTALNITGQSEIGLTIHFQTLKTREETISLVEV